MFSYLFGAHLVHLLVDVESSSEPSQSRGGALLIVTVQEKELGRLGAEGKGNQLKMQLLIVLTKKISRHG